MRDQLTNNRVSLPYPLMPIEERISAWKDIQGMWKNRKPDPIKELSKIRKELDRNIRGFPKNS